jgi:hypothetical protein
VSRLALSQFEELITAAALPADFFTVAVGGGGDGSMLVSKYFSASGRAAVLCSRRLPLRGGTLGAAAAAEPVLPAIGGVVAVGITEGVDEKPAAVVAALGKRATSPPAGFPDAVLTSAF